MCLYILPAGPAAPDKFQTIIDDNYTVVLIVYGTGPSIDTVLEVATARAALNPPRRVVWVRDVNVLTAQQKAKYFVASKTAIAVKLDDTIAAKLTLAQAQDRSEVEDAFTAAGA